jgi:hypothetical protein
MAIHAIAHCIVKPFNDPTQTVPYDRYQLKLNPGPEFDILGENIFIEITSG